MHELWKNKRTCSSDERNFDNNDFDVEAYLKWRKENPDAKSDEGPDGPAGNEDEAGELAEDDDEEDDYDDEDDDWKCEMKKPSGKKRK